ncbi:MAG: aminopeptidase [Chloroflexota bacterium]|nr:aminopeptidase [Chloroflexota bacterium]
MTAEIDLKPGAKVAVETCLGISSSDRVIVFTDEPTAAIGAALYDVIEERGARVVLKTLESIGARPLLQVPPALWAFLDGYAPTATFYAASGQKGEIRFRIPLIETLREKYNVRHGHMIGITPEIMQTGMLADYHKVAKRTHEVYEIVKHAKQIRVTNPTGTDLTGSFDHARLKWVIWDGLYREQGRWGNLPEGETFTSPVNVEGVITASVMGDFFSKKYGLLAEPFRLEIQGGLLVGCSHSDQAMVQEFWTYLDGVENGRRIGEFAVGTNEFLGRLIGNLLQDEKYPGVHVAFGNPYAKYTGATWDSPVHVDVVIEQTSVWVDGQMLMEAGRFVY